MEIDTGGQNAMVQRNDNREYDEFIPKEDKVMLKRQELASERNLIAEKNVDQIVQSAQKDTIKNDQMTYKPAITLTKRLTKSLKDQTTIQQSVDQRYYAGYSKKDIHKDMLEDEVRVKTYAEAIEQQCKGKRVLDVGSGSGVLSGYALMVGAKEVYGVDKANVKKIMNQQLKKMKVNLKESKFEFINDTIESDTAQEKIPEVDVIVSEWMGYFLLFENMIGSYIFAIKKFLKPDGIMIPSEANMFINAAAYEGRIAPKFRDGLAVTDIFCKTDYLISDPANIKKIDFTDRENLVNPLDEGFASDFKIVVTKAGEFNAFIGSFDVQLAEDILFDTSPVSPKTHWKQSLFFITTPVQVSKGDIIKGSVKVNAGEVNYRNLIVKFAYKVEGKGDSQVEEVFTFE